MELVILSTGAAKCIYDETMPLSTIGKVEVTRASHVEPNLAGKWTADLSPVGGPTLGPFVKRTEALAAEVNWLRNNWLIRQD